MVSERYHVDADLERDICLLDENGLVVASMPHGNDDECERSQMETAAMLAAAPQLADALSLALTWLTDPDATEGREAVEKAINDALNAAVGD